MFRAFIKALASCETSGEIKKVLFGPGGVLSMYMENRISFQEYCALEKLADVLKGGVSK